MTKTDDVLLWQRKTLDAYLKSIFPFQYKGKTFCLVDHFIASQYMKCNVCGNYPIIEVSVIRSEDGPNLYLGNNCIDRITNRSVSKWFKKYRRKRQNVIKNRKYIDGISRVLNAYEKNELPFRVTEGDVIKLRKALERMCNGLNPTRRQEQVAECYINRKANSEAHAR